MSDGMILGDVLQTILEAYPSPRNIGPDEQYHKTNSDPELQELATQTVKSSIKSALGTRADDFKIRPTIGQTTMADIPYIPLMRRDETQTSRKGVYVVYLFDTEAERLYLTLNQGSTEAKRASGRISGKPHAKDILRNHASMYRGLIDWPDGFTKGEAGLTTEIATGTETEDVSRAVEYNAGTIVSRAYEMDELGGDATEAIVDDLLTLLDTYDTFLDTLYSVPEIDSQAAGLWKVSPEGGEDQYWQTWRDEGIASIGWPEKRYAADEVIEEVPQPHNSPQRQVYNFQREITEGDVIIAGAPMNNIDVTFAIGRVTDGHYETMKQYDDPTAVGPAEFEHTTFINVDWHVFSDSGVAVNCLKGGRRLFNNWTVNPVDARLDHFLGAVGRRMDAANLTDDFQTLIDETAAHLGLERSDTGYSTESVSTDHADDVSTDNSDSISTYADWWEQHENVVEKAGALPPVNELVFPDGDQEELLSRIQTAISNNKHIIFTGPPGTGKTKLARHVANHYAGNKHEMVTATADWSTFDTIGGFRPTESQKLRFHMGLFLDRFQDEAGMPTSEWLIIDELNRADIDKAFGSLLSALTRETIQLPYTTEDDAPITLIGGPTPDDSRQITENHYFIPEDWRLLGTMNTYDKTSLYQLSYAFMRRFAFIPVSVPEDSEIDNNLTKRYASAWFEGSSLDTETAADLADLWKRINSVRSIGPAILRDILADYRQTGEADFTDPLIMYVMPQLEGLSKTEQREFIKNIKKFDDETDTAMVDISALEKFVLEYFGVEVDQHN